MKAFKTLALTLALTASSIAMVPQSAKAYLLAAGAAGYTPADGPWGERYIRRTTVLSSLSWVGLCLVLLPFCLLDQESDAQASVTTEELAANGYSSQEIALIQKDQKELVQKLAEQNIKLMIKKNDTKKIIEREIKSVYPNVSDLYLDFAMGSIGLK